MSFFTIPSLILHIISILNCIAAVWIQGISIYRGEKPNTFYNRIFVYISLNFLMFHVCVASYMLLGTLYYFGSKSAYQYIQETSFVYQSAVVFAMTAGNLGPVVLCSLWKGVSNFEWLGPIPKRALSTFCRDANLKRFLYLMNSLQIGMLICFNIWFSENAVQLTNRISLIPFIDSIIFIIICVPALYDVARTIRYMRNQASNSNRDLIKTVQTYWIFLVIMFILVSSYLGFIMDSAVEQILPGDFFTQQSKMDEAEMHVTATDALFSPIILGSCGLGILGSGAVLVNHFRSISAVSRRDDKKPASTDNFMATTMMKTAAKVDQPWQ